MRIVLFDIDGTLIHTGGAGGLALESALLEEFALGEIRGAVEYSGRTDRAISQDLLRLHELHEIETHWDRLRGAYLRRLPAALAARDGRVLPGVRELLDCLADRDDVAVGLLTGNLEQGARLKLGHYDLSHYFAFGGFGDWHTDRDEVAAEALEAAERFLGQAVAADDVVVIGDTPLDVRCARSISARAVAVLTGWHAREDLVAAAPDHLLDDLSDTAALLEILER